MKKYLLDTNIVSLAVRGNNHVLKHLTSVPMSELCISAITHAELMYGLANRPEARRLHRLVSEFLLRVDVLPFDTAVAEVYGTFRAGVEASGRSLSAPDMQIAAHAHGIGAVLVSNDRAFSYIHGLLVEDWSLDEE